MIYRIDYDGFSVSETELVKTLRSKDANYNFNKETGEMVTWGSSLLYDADRFPSPTILDMEVTTICKGVNGVLCPFCYKANSPNGKFMSMETFKKIMSVIPKSVTQIAFGADSTLESNPYLFDMMEYARKNKGIIPNVTAAQISPETANKLAKLCGAVAISRYHDKDACYDSIKLLTDRGMEQVNMHFMLSDETYDRCVETINDIVSDQRLSKLNALVILSLKKKGRGSHGFNCVSQERFNNIVKLAMDSKINIGFDSCSSFKALTSLGEKYKDMIIPCESTLESSYINVDGKFFPCSFMEGEVEGIDVLACKSEKDFIDNVWNNQNTENFRNSLLATDSKCQGDCRKCPFYEV